MVARKRENRSLGDEFLLLEHDPVYTIGRTPDQSSLRGALHLPHPLFAINRGGQATYHGPGQLIGYPIIDLRRYGQDLHRYLRWLEQLLIELLACYKIDAGTRHGLTGVWVQNRKIASIGVGVRGWITMHGFALNLGGDLSPFDQIVPCGISNVTITSIEKETGRALTLADVAGRIGEIAQKRINALLRTETRAQRGGSDHDPIRRQLFRCAGKSAARVAPFRYRSGRARTSEFAEDSRTAGRQV